MNEHAEGALVRFPAKQRGWVYSSPFYTGPGFRDRYRRLCPREVFVYMGMRVVEPVLGEKGGQWTRLLSLADGHVWWTTLSRNLRRA